MPESAEEAIEAADSIVSGNAGRWGNVHHWHADRVRAGDWTPVQWFDGTLADVAWELERLSSLEPLGLHHQIGPMGRAAQNSYRRCAADEARADDRATRIFDTISAKARRAMAGEADQWVVPGGGKRVHLWQRIREHGSTLLVAERYDTVSGRLTAVYSEEPTFGFGWRPVATINREMSKSICLWLNSTPGRLLLLNRRAKKLTYPSWSTAHWKEIPIPKGNLPGIRHLVETFETVAKRELTALELSNSDETRKLIDGAAALAVGLDPSAVADWRGQLAAEPTITNVRASD